MGRMLAGIAADRMRHQKTLLGLAVLAGVALAGCQPSPAANLNLPAAASPLDQAWVELIAVYEEQFQQLASDHNAQQAEAAVGTAVEFQRKKHAALTKIAQLGGEAPPIGVPEKYRQQYKDAEDRLLARDEVVSQMLAPDRREALNQQVRDALAAEPQLAENPFHLSVETRASATQATVTLLNNKSLQGPKHQQMIALLRDLAGATQAEPVIEPDGTYTVVLSPVPDFNGFLSSIDFGAVSNRNDAAKTFTLAIDPQRFDAVASAAGTFAPAAAGGPPGPPGPPGSAPPGPPQPPGFAAVPAANTNTPGGQPVTDPQSQPPFGGPPGGARGGGPDQQMEARKAEFVTRMGGPGNCVTMYLDGEPASGTPEYAELLKKIKQATGARSSMGLRINGRRLLLLAPIEDFTLAVSKIDFGAVTAQNPETREITVAVGNANP